jgi:zinc protease
LRIIEQAFAELQKKPVPAAELDKIKNRLELGFLQGMETAGGKAEQIGFYETTLGDAGFVFERLEQYRRVTAADVQRVAKRYFDPRRRTRVTVVPGDSKDVPGANGQVSDAEVNP